MSNKEEKVENINAKENLLEEDALTSKVDDDSSSSSDDAKSDVIEVQHKSLKTVQIVGVIIKLFFFKFWIRLFQKKYMWIISFVSITYFFHLVQKRSHGEDGEWYVPVTFRIIFPIRPNPLIFLRGIAVVTIQYELGSAHPKTKLLCHKITAVPFFLHFKFFF